MPIDRREPRSVDLSAILEGLAEAGIDFIRVRLFCDDPKRFHKQLVIHFAKAMICFNYRDVLTTKRYVCFSRGSEDDSDSG